MMLHANMRQLEIIITFAAQQYSTASHDSWYDDGELFIDFDISEPFDDDWVLKYSFDYMILFIHISGLLRTSILRQTEKFSRIK